jgi:hypothetical protein
MIKKVMAGCIALLLISCDSGPSSAKRSTTEILVIGQVVREEKLMPHTEVQAKDRNGNLITHTPLDSANHFSLKLPKGIVYPVILSVRPDEQSTELKAAVLNETVNAQDISSTTTTLVDNAMVLGGLTEQNLSKAAQGAMTQIKTVGGSGGGKVNPQKQYGGWH